MRELVGLIEPRLQDPEVGVALEREATGLDKGEDRTRGRGKQRGLIGALREDEEQQNGHGALTNAAPMLSP